MEHRIKKPLGANATWERRIEVMRDAVNGGRSLDYAYVTAVMAFLEAKDSNDYERASRMRNVLYAIKYGVRWEINNALDQLEELNHE